MSKVTIIYGSSSGVAEDVAKKIQSKIGTSVLYNIYKLDLDSVKDYDFYILVTSTAGFGELQDDWDNMISKFSELDFTGKRIALVGVGDSSSYPSSFVGSIAVLYNALKDKAEIVGEVSTDGYTFDESEAVVDDKFIGLPIDDDNEADLTDERIDNWLKGLKSYL